MALTILALLHYKPLHPYGVQRLIQEWGKDHVVNVSQRASLYRTMERLLAEGFIAVRETSRDQAYPERTVYEVTEAGQAIAHQWITAMLGVPKQEFPEFPAALSNLLLLTPQDFLATLDQRLATLRQTVDALDESLSREAGLGLPRIAMLESEYLRAVTAAEAEWVRSVADDLRHNRLPWDAQALAAFAEDQEP
ncbi:PadR family transcriptional regulator [Rugosimonospora acidiphila]|uniref:PadR family transcriptional regulator n=1 Tax=Rugosimonospora acidiphila TaxID=556531 RepID=A0ABP9S789_9ACTN